MADLLSFPISATQAAQRVQSEISQNLPSTIEQTERLFTTRTRGINYLTGGGDRGQHTFIQLLTTRKDKLIESHTNEGMSKPTSLGTSSSGPLANAANGKYGEFLLTDIRVSLDEKVQVSEVFGDAEVVYYFGRQPINVQFQGMLIDSPDNNWFIEFIEMYAHVFRGTELARNYELIKIITPNMSFIGSLTHMGYSQNSNREVDIPFEFTMLVKQIIPNAVMVPGKPATQGTSINSEKAEKFQTQAEIFSKKKLALDLTNTVKNPFSTIGDIADVMKSGTGVLSAGKNALDLFGGNSNLDKFLNGGGTSGNTSTGEGLSGILNSGKSLFTNVTSSLAGIRATLFSPVYGVLNSLTKLIKNVTGSINSVISAFTNPVRDILRDVRNVANQAVGVVNLINNSIDSVGNNFKRVDSDLRATLATLKRTAGVISTAPKTITSHLRDLVNAGKLPSSAAFLQNGGSVRLTNANKGTTKLFLLNSGPKHTPERGARL